jgi:dihydropteroate synthase
VIKAWDLGRRELLLRRRPLVMGILNVTPDSFSDGGRHSDPQLAHEVALRMEADGGEIIDIGGESTRPYSDPVGVQQELDRVIPVIERLAGKLSIPISIDTCKSVVAEAAVGAGAEIINDVTALQADPKMAAVACDCGVGVCVMHMQGTPQTMQDHPHYGDVVQEVYEYLVARRDFCLGVGIRRDRICLDPGLHHPSARSSRCCNPAELVSRFEPQAFGGIDLCIGSPGEGAEERHRPRSSPEQGSCRGLAVDPCDAQSRDTGARTRRS